MIAFSTTRRSGPEAPPPVPDDRLSPLFAAAIEATEEALVDSLLQATSVRGRGGLLVRAIPVDRLRAILGRARR